MENIVIVIDIDTDILICQMNIWFVHNEIWIY